MLAPTTRPCSCAVGSIACTAASPVTRSLPSATSPAAYTLGTFERSWSSTTMARLIAMPASFSQSRFVRMPVAMITTSPTTSPPDLNRRRLRPLTSSTAVTALFVRTVTPCFSSQVCTSFAAASSTMRGRMRGAISTIVSLAPSDRIELRIVNAMNPAPTITTGDHAPRLVERPERMDALAVGAQHRRAHRGGAGGDQAVVVLDLGAVVERARVRLDVEVRRAPSEVRHHAPLREHGPSGREDVRLRDRAIEVVREHHARVRALGAHQRDLRFLALFLADRPDRVDARGTAADDEMARGHQCAPWRTYWPRSAAKAASQSVVATSSYVIAAVGHASAHAGSPPQRLHLNALRVLVS